MKQKNDQLSFFSTSRKEINFENKLSKLRSINFETNGSVCLKMSDGKKLFFTEQGKEPFTNEKTGEEVFEYSGAKVDGNEEKSWAVAYFKVDGYSPNHHHNVQTEVYFITSGQARLVIDDEEFLMKAGDSKEITPGQKHQIFNTGKTKLSLVVECTPAWKFDDYLLEKEETLDNKVQFN